MKTVAAFAIALACAGALSAAPAQAQNARSFVSAHGADSAACTLVAPCRTLAAAFLKTNAGGEIDILDTAGYGGLTITKAISIINDGVGTAGVIVPTGAVGITINAGPNDAISLRGLSVEGGGVGQTGVLFNSGASLTITNSVIRHVTQRGIHFGPNATSSLSVSNSLVADNGDIGVIVAPTGSGAATAVFNRIEVNNNVNKGIVVDGSGSTGTVNATVFESVAAGNRGDAGFHVVSGAGQAPTSVMLTHSVSANNNTGLKATGAGATIRAAQSTVTGNASGWIVSGSGVVASYGDNYVDGNGINTGSLSSISKQ